jgi:hypothetical protein
LLRYGRWIAPPLVSIALLAWLIWSITPQRLGAAMTTPAFPWLVLATFVQVGVLFLWDTVCVWWLFSLPHRQLSFRTVLRARVDTVIWSAINLEIGQAAFSWRIAKLTDDSLKRTLGRSLLLGIFDTGTLQGLALAGSLLVDEPIIHWLKWISAAIVVGLVLLGTMIRFLPMRWRAKLEQSAWFDWLRWWTWRDSIVLSALRLAMFLLVLLYAWAALVICQMLPDARTVFGVIPFVITAESLPGAAGLGQRETALVYLLHPSDSQRALVLAWGLTWSVGVILGRVAIGLLGWILPHRADPTL